MEKYLVLNGYNWDGTRDTQALDFNKIAKSLAAKTDWMAFSIEGTIGCDLTKNNRSGFSALPGGYRYYSGEFSGQSGQIGEGGWWSTTEDTVDDTSKAWDRGLEYSNEALSIYHDGKCSGFSVRLVRD